MPVSPRTSGRPSTAARPRWSVTGSSMHAAFGRSPASSTSNWCSRMTDSSGLRRWASSMRRPELDREGCAALVHRARDGARKGKGPAAQADAGSRATGPRRSRLSWPTSAHRRARARDYGRSSGRTLASRPRASGGPAAPTPAPGGRRSTCRSTTTSAPRRGRFPWSAGTASGCLHAPSAPSRAARRDSWRRRRGRRPG